MSVAGLSFKENNGAVSCDDRLAQVRAVGRVEISCGSGPTGTRLVDLVEQGGYRVKFPDPTGTAIEPVIINTGGGVAGGDRLDIDIRANEGAHVATSTATAERIYRSSGADTYVTINLHAADGAILSWLPQATILFSGARLSRRFNIDVSGGARLLMAEATVFGRVASGETMGPGIYRDDWRVRRDGRLLFAESVRMDGHIGDTIAKTAVMNGARSSGLMLYVGADAEDRRADLRESLQSRSGIHGISAWNGMLVLRVLAGGLSDVHDLMQQAIKALTRAPLPRTWAN
ncbi:urease accessory protein UreD [Leptospira interrogans]